MAIRSNDARRASTKNQSDPVDPICCGISDHSEATPQGSQRNASQTNSLTRLHQDDAGSSSGKSVAGRRHRARRWLSCALSAGALGLFLSGVPGCTTTSGMMGAIGDGHCIDEFMVNYRNRAMAQKAWHCQKHQFCNQHSKEFRAGFTDGFMEVAGGGNGCVPAIAPKEYWGWRYQSAQGQGAVNSWFEGYPMGVKAAEQAGVGNWGQVTTAGYHNQNAQQTPAAGVANPFYGPAAGAGQVIDGGAIQEPGVMPALEAPATDSGPVETGPAGAIEDIIDLDFDSASTNATPQGSDFDEESIFGAANPVGSSSDARIAGLDDSASGSGVRVDVDEVFGSADREISSGQVNSSIGDSMPFSFE
ncbi:hypothetical protein LF1_23270 [Rubripirellula obstinata]|uniref:Uncharacterized protein n=1 Tax=Rubripirellula obstinata TaxID=406547 RepID=A0A5B1CJT6_9BACT|nr:hypothetical protein [Rubripirellula obstinata]KAA1259790.1 hypothetical protein LF1_23270 [Rubripirellula obstinata]